MAERQFSKLKVEGSSPFTRSYYKDPNRNNQGNRVEERSGDNRNMDYLWGISISVITSGC